MYGKLNSALNFAGLDTRCAHFHALYGLAYQSFKRLQIGQPTSLTVRVIVRTQEGVLNTALWSFVTYITTLSHKNIPVEISHQIQKFAAN